MNIFYLILSIVVWLISAICIISTIFDVGKGKYTLSKPDFWGAVIFHGATAILALWLFVKAMG